MKRDGIEPTSSYACMLCLRLFRVIMTDGPSAPKLSPETFVVSENAGETGRGGGVLLCGETACDRDGRGACIGWDEDDV